MKTTFETALGTQRLEHHVRFLKSNQFGCLEDHADEARKLHDLYDWADESWFEAKTDYSGFTDRLLVEYKANVPEAKLEGMPLRRPLPHAPHAERINALDARYNALALDTRNLEPRHFLSYHFKQTGATFLFSVRELRRLIQESSFEWIVVGERSESWRGVCAVVPLALTRPLKAKDIWTGGR